LRILSIRIRSERFVVGNNEQIGSARRQSPLFSHDDLCTVFVYLPYRADDKQSDPYVIFALEQDNVVFDKDFGTRKSTVKSGQLSPVYGETFTFNLPDSIGLDNVVLTITVKDDDPIHDDSLGKTKIKLEKLDIDAVPRDISAVIDNNWFSKDAKIYLKLSYEST
jgi:Ca2+-dependent lipid-binding protein